nr:MAG TPA: hypothetical protein [Caudoviricetes sp.]
MPEFINKHAIQYCIDIYSCMYLYILYYYKQVRRVKNIFFEGLTF